MSKVDVVQVKHIWVFSLKIMNTSPKLMGVFSKHSFLNGRAWCRTNIITLLCTIVRVLGYFSEKPYGFLWCFIVQCGELQLQCGELFFLFCLIKKVADVKNFHCYVEVLRVSTHAVIKKI